MNRRIAALLFPCLGVAALVFAAPAEDPRADIVVADFEGSTWGDWAVEGDAFGNGPAAAEKLKVSGFRGRKFANSFGSGDAAKGAITSPPLTLDRDYLAFLISGGKKPGEVGIELLIDGKAVRSETGDDSGTMRWVSWPVAEWRGKTARVRVFDRAAGGWGHVSIDSILLTDKPRGGTGVWRLDEYRRSPDYLNERYRPGYHFTPELNWMNDPNGLVWFDGEYHLFYQFNPHGNEWGHMSWGHAVSNDLLHWKHLPTAIAEEYGVMAFSGSAVADIHNSSGFGEKGKPPLVAVYTGHSKGRQTQDIAFSLDRGRTFSKYSGNPVIDIGEADFRDPKVFWYAAATQQWVMVVSLADQKKLQFYGSKDLKAWTHLSDFGPAGVKDKPNWECPDLFELKILGEKETRWVLKADMGGGSVAGGSGGEYFIGTFDGTKFVPDSPESRWIDYGRDFYASQTWTKFGAKDERTLLLGWMNNWETCLNPTHPWRSAMSIPRELSLRRIGKELRLCQYPVRELTDLYGAVTDVGETALGEKPVSLNAGGQQLDICLEFKPGTATDFGVRVLKKGDRCTTVGYDAKAGKVYVDRTKSGDVSWHPKFAGRHAGPLAPDPNGFIRMRILVDRSSVEVFGNDGETVITELVFPDEDATGIELFAVGGEARLRYGKIFPLKSAKSMPGK